MFQRWRGERQLQLVGMLRFAVVLQRVLWQHHIRLLQLRAKWCKLQLLALINGPTQR